MAPPTTYMYIALALLALGNAQYQLPLKSNPPRSIPVLGFGTWRLDTSNASDAVSVALQSGYRHLDCAAIYGNEKEVGRGIKDGLEATGLVRSDIWITSKLWNDHHQPDQVAAGLDKTLSDLGLEYLDLYLMHWPVASSNGKNYLYYVETWLAMEKLLSTGKVRNIGVCNFSPKQLKRLISESNIKPAVHQFELHPYLQQTEWVQWHKDNGISVTAYSPLANLNPIYTSLGKSKDAPPSLLENEDISKIAHERGCTNAQVALAWGMKRRTSVIPKSQHKDRIEENFKSLECALNKEDYTTIAKIEQKYLKRFNNPSGGWDVPLYEGLDDSIG